MTGDSSPPSRGPLASRLRRLTVSALTLLALLPTRSPRAADVTWQDPVSGDFSDPQRWLVDGVPPQRRVPTLGDHILIASTPPIVVTVANSPTVESADIGESVTLTLQSDFMVTTGLSGSPVIQGPGTLHAIYWEIGAGAPFASIVGARAVLGRLNLPGAGLGLKILGGSQVLVSHYQDPGLTGKRPIIIDGAGSSWTVIDDITDASGLEVMVQNGGSVQLAAVQGVGAFVLESGSQLTATRFDPQHLAVRGGSRLITGDARPRGFGPSLGLGPAEVMGGSWTVQGRLTVPGVSGTVFRLGGQGQIQATDFDLVNSARFEIGTVENPAPNDPSAGLLKVAQRLRIQDGTLKIRNGTVECGELELRGGGATVGEAALDLLDGRIDVSGKATFNARATATALSFTAASSSIGSLASSSGSLVCEDVLMNFGESLVIGGAGGGSLRVKGDFVRPIRAKKFVLGQEATGQGSAEFTVSGGDWDIGQEMVVGDLGQGTLTILGGALFSAETLAVAIARQPGSRGTVNLRGAGTLWQYLPFDFTSELVVGERGQGQLSIDGAALSASTIVIGRSAEDNQAIVLGPEPSSAGASANLEASRDLVVGDGGHGTLEIAAAGRVQSSMVIVGRQSTSTNRLTVSPGSTLVGLRGLLVGDRGRGILQCRGSVVTDQSITLGQGESADGTLEITGSDARLMSARGGIVMARGNAAKGSLALRSGGQIEVRELATEAASTGRADLTVDGAGSQLRVADSLRLGQVGRPAGPTTLGISGGADAKVGRELLLRRPANLVLGGGSMVVGNGNPPAPGFLRVTRQGTLFGDGQIQGDIVAEDGSQVRPGATLGSLSVVGKLDLREGSTLVLEVSGPVAPSQHDSIHTTGSMTVRGTVEIRFINGYAPAAGDRLCFAQAEGGLVFAPTEFRVTGLAPGFQFKVESDPLGSFCLSASSNGAAASEPTLDAKRSDATGEVVLHWSVPDPWRLETSSSTASEWAPVTVTSSEDGNHSHIVSRSDPARFFRLRRP